jgi:hypothetical protein
MAKRRTLGISPEQHDSNHNWITVSNPIAAPGVSDRSVRRNVSHIARDLQQGLAKKGRLVNVRGQVTQKEPFSMVIQQQEALCPLCDEQGMFKMETPQRTTADINGFRAMTADEDKLHRSAAEDNTVFDSQQPYSDKTPAESKESRRRTKFLNAVKRKN